MPTYTLQLTLLSDTTFGRGDGVVGLVDTEIQHDEFGLPYLHGRGVKGLLVAQCAEVLGALNLQNTRTHNEFIKSAKQLFGEPGSDVTTSGVLACGHARLPADLQNAIEPLLTAPNPRIARESVLSAFTSIRRQTKVDERTGAAEEDTLRATRVLTRGLVFTSSIWTDRDLSDVEKALMAACVKAMRHVGTHRARGLGHCKAKLFDSQADPLTDEWFKLFAKEVVA